ncbi:M20 family metallopeptidase [Roseospira marina]|uniref:Probable succinyl-diaminopimelate desuccinylase n=1 Tax=Roseospira marina TaxID=140057 RepID=A0A5M6IB23_9PROT|nr:M20 family metallopeptidase [Roseospira marina]KAA5605322.1 M20 family metallopeptidase [Roseospira marina]MBB4314793.1 succinyl-diaminopimelate desuccinylase [Roseospira marina]MBB5087782.1 succinyl-diaminopimelate desuccinylase [Roseospira marina]
MANPLDVVDVTRRLIAFETINPPGSERPCAEYLRDLLEDAGFRTERHDLAPDRASLIARLGDGSGKPLCFTGHIDTVPLGAQAWTRDPFGGEIVDGRLYGRGATDMKSGVAAFVCASIAEADRLRDGPGVVLVITAGEETGCDGAVALARDGRLGKAGALVVAEPTANAPFVGHKGALWLTARTRGVTAHGSMPEHGDNAIYKAARAIARLADFDFNIKRHPVLGTPTLNVGRVQGGMNVNSVPDRADIGLDIRTIPGMDHAALRDTLAGYMGEGAEVDAMVDLNGVWTEPATPWLAAAAARANAVSGHSAEPATAAYFTDASILTPAFGGIPTLILGPGEPAMAHQTDEYCRVDRLTEAEEIFRALIADWQAGPTGAPS